MAAARHCRRHAGRLARPFPHSRSHLARFSRMGRGFRRIPCPRSLWLEFKVPERYRKGRKWRLKMGGGGLGRRSDLGFGQSRRCLVIIFIFFIFLQFWTKARRRKAPNIAINERSL